LVTSTKFVEVIKVYFVAYAHYLVTGKLAERFHSFCGFEEFTKIPRESTKGAFAQS
jgi:hypothetical protein